MTASASSNPRKRGHQSRESTDVPPRFWDRQPDGLLDAGMSDAAGELEKLMMDSKEATPAAKEEAGPARKRTRQEDDHDATPVPETSKEKGKGKEAAFPKLSELKTAKEKDAEAEAKSKKEEENKGYLALALAAFAPPQTTYDGGVIVLRSPELRTASPYKLLMEYPAPYQTSLGRMMAAEGGGKFVWVHVYGHEAPRKADRDDLEKALGRAAKTRAIPGLKAEDYRVWGSPSKGAKSMIVECKSNKARGRLARTTGLTWKRPNNTSVSFFFQDWNSWGSTITFDVINGPNKFLEMVGRVWQAIEDVALVEATDSKTDFKPVRFDYQEVPVREMYQGVKGKIWRVRFAFDVEKAQQWSLPNSLGSWKAQGEILVKESPLCTQCISWSHSRAECRWWQTAGIAGEKMRPRDFVETTWNHIKRVFVVPTKSSKEEEEGGDDEGGEEVLEGVEGEEPTAEAGRGPNEEVEEEAQEQEPAEMETAEDEGSSPSREPVARSGSVSSEATDDTTSTPTQRWSNAQFS